MQKLKGSGSRGRSQVKPAATLFRELLAKLDSLAAMAGRQAQEVQLVTIRRNLAAMQERFQLTLLSDEGIAKREDLIRSRK